MHHRSQHQDHLSLRDAESWAALVTGTLLVAAGVRHRGRAGIGLAVAAAPLLYRGLTGRWPAALAGSGPPDDTRAALGGSRGVHVREAVTVDVPVAEVYRFWRQLDNLPRFMAHLEVVAHDESTGTSHWVARGPGGLRVHWDATVINDVENETLAWKSLPGADVISAGSVNFRPGPGDRGTEVRVNLQYAPPAGKAGAWLASLFGQAPGQVIREDLRRLKQLLEAGEVAQAGPALQPTR